MPDYVTYIVPQFSRTHINFQRVPIVDTSPAIFTATQTGNGQAAALQLGGDRNYSYNSVDNPVPRGAAMEFFSTGAGAWNPPVPGDIAFGHRSHRVLVALMRLPVDVTEASDR